MAQGALNGSSGLSTMPSHDPPTTGVLHVGRVLQTIKETIGSFRVATTIELVLEEVGVSMI